MQKLVAISLFLISVSVFASEMTESYINIWKRAIENGQGVYDALLSAYPDHKQYITECFEKNTPQKKQKILSIL